MSAFSTMVARTGFVEELENYLYSDNVIRLDKSTLVADDETLALEVALEKFENDALLNGWVVNAEDIDAYEKTNDDGEVFAWAIYAGGHENFDLEYED